MARARSTSQQGMPSLRFPCACFHTFNQSDEPDAGRVTSAHHIFVKLCPRGVKIVKVVYSKLPPKEGKKPITCRWTIIYRLDEDAQLNAEMIGKIRWYKPAYSKILKEVPYYVNMRLHIAVDYLVTGCRYNLPQTGARANSRSKVPKHYKNGEGIFIDSTRLEAIEYIANNLQDPIKELCLLQMLKLKNSRTERLDNALVEALYYCLPEHFDLLARYETQIRLRMNYPRDDEYPTLLHFAARFGLKKFVLQILERPEGTIACHIKNKYDMTPAESAESGGRRELARRIRRYTSLNQFCNMYSKLKEINHKLLKKDEDSTIGPEVFEGVHKVCFPLDYFYKSTLSSVQDLNLFLESAPNEPPPKTVHSRAPCEDKKLSEFLEILSDFNNLVQSAGADLEKLVEDWSNRNNVHKSFKEKQEQLKEMAQRYEKIEKETGKSAKEAEILDRASTFFEVTKTQDKKHEISSPSICSKHSQKAVIISSSSKSSGTTKEAGGTRLDNKELKDTSLNHNEENFETTALERLCSLVFASKPVKAVVYTNRSELIETIEEKTVTTPDTLSVKEKSDSQLPPSDSPVSGVEESYEEFVMLDADESEATHDKNETIDNMNEVNDDMNDANDNRVENASCIIS